MVALDAMVVSTALSTIQRDLDASIATLQWAMNAYNLSLAVLLLSGAALGDRFGRRRIFVGGLCLFVAASAACALAATAGWLIAARALQGAGAALMMPLAMALLSAAFPPAARGKALGLFSSITGLALVVGPVLGGAIAESLPWQWIFWVNLPIGAVLVPLARRRIPESFGVGMALDIPGVALATAAALGWVWGLVRGNAAGWNSNEVALALIAGAGLTMLFVAWELRAAAPMVPMRFFRARAFSSGIAASFLFYGAMYGVLFLLPQFFQAAQGCDALGAGLRLLPWEATLLVTAPVAGRLINQVGERPFVVIGLVLQTIGLAWVSALATPDVPYIRLVAPLVIAGVGVSAAMPAAQNAVLNAVAKDDVGKASGVFNMLRFLGGMFGIAVAAAIFGHAGSFASPQAFSGGFTAALRVSAALSIIGAAAALWLPGRRRLRAAPALSRL
jgi:EmrB/QacA subfamily drug resistance transporter